MWESAQVWLENPCHVDILGFGSRTGGVSIVRILEMEFGALQSSESLLRGSEAKGPGMLIV